MHLDERQELICFQICSIMMSIVNLGRISKNFCLCFHHYQKCINKSCYKDSFIGFSPSVFIIKKDGLDLTSLLWLTTSVVIVVLLGRIWALLWCCFQICFGPNTLCVRWNWWKHISCPYFSFCLLLKLLADPFRRNKISAKPIVANMECNGEWNHGRH